MCGSRGTACLCVSLACQVLLSAVPCFGILRHQFMSVTSVFFEKACDEAAASDFQAFLLSIAHPTTGVVHREAQVQVRRRSAGSHTKRPGPVTDADGCDPVL